MLAFAPTFPAQNDYNLDPLFSVSPEYLNLSTPDFTSSSSPESAEHHSVPQASDHVLNGRKTRVVRGPDGSFRNCSVCGDLATGWHYDVLSCNGCKTFFRRTLISKRKFLCSRGGDCQFTKDFRCACRACRFDKCVAAGMNPTAIHYPGKGAESPEHLQMVPVSISQINSEDFEYSQKLKLMMHREKNIQQMRSAAFPIFPMEDLEEILRQPCLFGKHTMEQSRSLVHKQVYEEHPILFWMVADLYLTIEYAKTFLCFQNMTESDQRCLLSHVSGVVQLSSEAYYSVLQESDSTSYPDGLNVLQYKSQCGTLREKKSRENFYREMYCKPVSLIRQLKLSMEEFVLFKALALFSPDETDLSKPARDDVGRKRLDILKYLRKLLTFKYGYKRGAEKLAECLFALPVFLQLAEKRRNYFILADLSKKFPHDVPPLLRTVYLRP